MRQYTRLSPGCEVWRHARVGGQAADALEAENAKLKKLLAEQMMDVSTLKGCRLRRACGLVGINPRAYRQLPTRSEDADLRGYPCMMVAHNGTERTSNAILK
tara:strand:- start:337 stop:642 length:306 start_codon:yes stop_codon:yes gene_type:complete